MQFARVPKCSCGGCKCNIAGQVGYIRAEDHLHYFLIGLDTPYEAIRSQLLAQHSLPSVEEAYQSVTNTKSLRIKNSDAREGVMEFKVEAKDKQKYTDNRDMFCTHCNREGHDNSSCYQLVGFPEWWDDRRKGRRGSGRGGRTSSSSRGGRGGRNNSTFAKEYAATVRANQVTGQSPSDTSVKAKDLDGLVGVSAEQVQQSIDVLSSKSRLQGNSNWIIDTGCTNHVTWDLSILSN